MVHCVPLISLFSARMVKCKRAQQTLVRPEQQKELNRCSEEDPELGCNKVQLKHNQLATPGHAVREASDHHLVDAW